MGNCRAMQENEKRVWVWEGLPQTRSEALPYLLQRWKLDPVCMAVEAFRMILHPYQAQIALDVNDSPKELYEFYGLDASFPKRMVLAPSGHGLGKTRLLAFLLWHHLITSMFSKGIVTAPSSDQLTGQLWGEMRKLKRRLGRTWPELADEWEVLSDKVVHTNPDYADWSILARTARPEKPEALQGAHALDVDDEYGDLAAIFGELHDKPPSGGIFVAIEEASGVDDSIRETLAGALSEDGAKFFAPGNPTRPDGWFARDLDATSIYAVHPLDCRMSDATQEYRMKYRDFHGRVHFPRIRGFVQPRYWESMLRECDGDEDRDRFRVRVRGLKPRSAFDSCIKAHWVDAAMARVPQAGKSEESPIVGMDFGLVNDKHGLAVRHGFVVPLVDEWLPPEHPDFVLMEAARRAIDAVETFGAKTIIGDSNGVGAGIMSYLSEYYADEKRKHLGVRVIHFNSGIRAVDHGRYYRRRDEMWFKKARAFLSDARTCLPPDALLKTQLLAPGYHEDTTRRIRVESKDEIKARSGEKSGNRADALLHTLMIKGEVESVENVKPAEHPVIFLRHFSKLKQSKQTSLLIA